MNKTADYPAYDLSLHAPRRVSRSFVRTGDWMQGSQSPQNASSPSPLPSSSTPIRSGKDQFPAHDMSVSAPQRVHRSYNKTGDWMSTPTDDRRQKNQSTKDNFPAYNMKEAAPQRAYRPHQNTGDWMSTAGESRQGVSSNQADYPAYDVGSSSPTRVYKSFDPSGDFMRSGSKSNVKGPIHFDSHSAAQDDYRAFTQEEAKAAHAMKAIPHDNGNILDSGSMSSRKHGDSVGHTDYPEYDLRQHAPKVVHTSYNKTGDWLEGPSKPSRGEPISQQQRRDGGPRGVTSTKDNFPAYNMKEAAPQRAYRPHQNTGDWMSTAGESRQGVSSNQADYPAYDVGSSSPTRVYKSFDPSGDFMRSGSKSNVKGPIHFDSHSAAQDDYRAFTQEEAKAAHAMKAIPHDNGNILDSGSMSSRKHGDSVGHTDYPEYDLRQHAPKVVHTSYNKTGDWLEGPSKPSRGEPISQQQRRDGGPRGVTSTKDNFPAYNMKEAAPQRAHRPYKNTGDWMSTPTESRQGVSSSKTDYPAYNTQQAKPVRAQRSYQQSDWFAHEEVPVQRGSGRRNSTHRNQSSISFAHY